MLDLSNAVNDFVPVSLNTSRGRPLLICFSHLRWNFVFQRPQHLLTRAAKDFNVFYIEEPIFLAERNKPQYAVTVHAGGPTVLVPELPEGLTEAEIVEAQRILLDAFLNRQSADTIGFWYYTPLALDFSDHISPDFCIYDCMDELSAFRGASPRMTEAEKRLFEKADVVFTGGMSLYQAKRGKHRNVHAFPSSVDKAHFAKARNAKGAEPESQAHIPHPRIGFYGVVDERMDLELVENVARLRPEYQFIVIGPVVKIDPATLPRLENIHWLDGRSYTELPQYLSEWDAAFMPFALNESTRFISPTKTPEFLAAGLPVVSTAITDVVKPYGKLGLVEISRSAEEMASAIDLMMARPRETWLKEVDAYLATISWDSTWSQMKAQINKVVGRQVVTTQTPSLRSSVMSAGSAARV